MRSHLNGALKDGQNLTQLGTARGEEKKQEVELSFIQFQATVTT